MYSFKVGILLVSMSQCAYAMQYYEDFSDKLVAQAKSKEFLSSLNERERQKLVCSLRMATDKERPYLKELLMNKKNLQRYNPDCSNRTDDIDDI